MIDDIILAAYAAGDTAAQASVRAIDWLTWLWVVGLSSLGGAVNFYQKMKTGQSRPFNFTELVGELFISGFVGIVTFLMLRSYVNEMVAAGVTGITAHMGSRAILLAERIIEKFIEKKLHVD